MKTFVINKIYHLHEKFEFDVKELWGTEEKDEE